MLTVHHLGKSQSERIVWLCEELGIPYELKIYTRAPVLAPEEFLTAPPPRTSRPAPRSRVKLRSSQLVIEQH